MQIDFAIKYKTSAAPERITTEIVDMIAFEEHFNLSIATLGDEPRMSHLSWLAWHAAHRQGKTQLEFMEWASTLEDITGEEAGEIVPLESSQSTGSSPVSP